MPNVFQDVRRVHTGNGGHIEPPLDRQWSPLRKLLWLAAVIEVDTGLKVDVKEWEQAGRFTFNVSLPHSASGPFDFDSAWTFMNGAAAAIKPVPLGTDSPEEGNRV